MVISAKGSSESSSFQEKIKFIKQILSSMLSNDKLA
jgi:hypothetical protein